MKSKGTHSKGNTLGVSPKGKLKLTVSSNEKKSNAFDDKKKKKNAFHSQKFSKEDSGMEKVLADSRFSHVSIDPRYRKAPVKQRKVQIDKRFESVFTDDVFYEKTCMDPRGRPKNFSTKENLKKFYNLKLSDEEESDDDKEENVSEDEEESDDDKEENVSEDEEESGSENEDVSDDDTAADGKMDDRRKSEQGSLSKKKEEKASGMKPEKSEKNKGSGKGDYESNKIPNELLELLKDMDYDLARGEAFFSDDSSDDDSTTTDEDEEDVEEFEWGELDHDAQWDCETDVEETLRFAVCNMDWDRIKAVDLMVLFSSFAPVAGNVKKVTIYPSEFGKERLKEEAVKGPQELIKLAATKTKELDSDLANLEKIAKGTLGESDATSDRQIEALRRYQRNRLKYFYAVVECDSLETAKRIYKECDRTPYELAGVILDLRYIPSEMNFDDEVPHDVCDSLPESYENEEFQTTALLNAKPTLTWDETDRRRKKTLTTAMTKALKRQNFDDENLKLYVASGSEESEAEVGEESDSDDEESKAKRIAKFRELIGEIEDKQKKKEMLIDKEETFELNEEDEGGKDSVGEKKENLTPFEKYLVKRKEKRKAKKTKKEKSNDDFIDNESKNTDEDYDKSLQISDDELPEDVGDIKKDPFFTTQTNSKVNKRKKSKKTKIQHPEEENDGNLELLLMEEEAENKKHFNMRKIFEDSKKLDEKKNKKKKQLQEGNEDANTETNDFKIKLDSRFAAVSESEHFSIDPSHPQYKKTKAMDTLINDIVKKRKRDITPERKVSNKKSYLGVDVSNLVKKVKLKTSK